MKAKLSALNLIKFQVQEFNHKTILSENLEQVENLLQIDLASHSIYLDFEQYLDDSNFLINMQMHINKKKETGYELKVLALGHFQINEHHNITPKMKANLLSISSVNIMISNIRGYFKNITSYGIFGTYLLPSIDITDLLSQKIKTQNKNLKQIKKKK